MAENLINYLNDDLYHKTYPKPVYFGYAVCPYFTDSCDNLVQCMCYGASKYRVDIHLCDSCIVCIVCKDLDMGSALKAYTQ